MRRATAPESDAIASPAYAPPMHPLHGLQYAQPDNVYTFLLGEPVPERGRIHKSVLDKPGFGVELNRDCNLKRPYQH